MFSSRSTLRLDVVIESDQIKHTLLMTFWRHRYM